MARPRFDKKAYMREYMRKRRKQCSGMTNADFLRKVIAICDGAPPDGRTTDENLQRLVTIAVLFVRAVAEEMLSEITPPAPPAVS